MIENMIVACAESWWQRVLFFVGFVIVWKAIDWVFARIALACFDYEYFRDGDLTIGNTLIKVTAIILAINIICPEAVAFWVVVCSVVSLPIHIGLLFIGAAKGVNVFGKI